MTNDNAVNRKIADCILFYKRKSASQEAVDLAHTML